MLRVFATSTEYVPHCKAILDSSSSPYAQLLASSSLIKIVTEHSMATQVRTWLCELLDLSGNSTALPVLIGLWRSTAWPRRWAWGTGLGWRPDGLCSLPSQLLRSTAWPAPMVGRRRQLLLRGRLAVQATRLHGTSAMVPAKAVCRKQCRAWTPEHHRAVLPPTSSVPPAVQHQLVSSIPQLHLRQVKLEMRSYFLNYLDR